ncbi:MAG: thioredoxin-like domain-containing protein [Nannocystaceae bacterium]
MRRLARSALLAAALLPSCRGGDASVPDETPMAVTPPVIEAPSASALESDEPDAPSLDGAIAWLGVDAPLTLRELRGQVVVLDFWTYCCINCMHVLPVLRDIEEELAHEPLVVLGVHSAKFDGERDPQRIAAAMARYGVDHPVAVDSEMTIWRRYGIRGWPSLVIIRPNGRIAAIASGEPDPEVLRRALKGVIDEARADGSLAAAPRPRPARKDAQAGPLAFPGKVIALADGSLAVSDSGHHRILITDRAGRVREAIGGGLRGLRDGAYADAAFDDPQGLAAAQGGSILYVADTRNHVIRRIDRKKRTVTTIAGTGSLGEVPLVARPTSARAAPLRSPWDLALARDERTLYVALAGSHQIAALDLKGGLIRRLAGSGREDLIDGDASVAAFAQPSGLALAGKRLYVADSEVSAIRAVEVESGATSTVIGTGLFDFGARDGALDQGRLQHALGVLAADADHLIVADTYNNALRSIDRKKGEITTFVAGDAGLHEPGGLTREKDGSIVIADTNGGRLVRLRKGATALEAIAIEGAPPVIAGSVAAAAEVEGEGPAAQTLSAREAVWNKSERLEVRVTLTAPAGHELSEGAPLDLAIRAPGAATPIGERHTSAAGGPEIRAIVVVYFEGPPPPTLDLDVRAIACDAVNHAYCTPIRARYTLAVPPTGEAPERGSTLTYTVPLTTPTG